ncbi:MAG: phenylalanine--tRNA ligase subunit beta [Proteobacteria bacterium]|nr:phenylalanine--tRNA ligase subunit beta [Pseudomonadota bacterium]
MNISEQWLREWVDPDTDAEGLAHQLTMAGLEVESVEPVAAEFSKVLVGKVLSVERHPDADKLTLCQVDAGTGETLQIICGAPNVYKDMKAAVALVGARLAEGSKIRAARIRGVQSQGMLCSARELGLGDDHDGVLDLDPSAPVGASFREWMSLDDRVIKFDLTPNRGDCFCVAGVARDVAAINRLPLNEPDISDVPDQNKTVFPVEVVAKDACPSFSSRVVSGIRPDARTPMWMCEKLRRSGLRPIHPVVDVTNFVMLELGQPLHAFDLDIVTGGIRVRYAKKNEKLTLLDGREISLDTDVVLVADHKRPLAIAGIMGGENSGVTEQTRNVLFEAAYWSPMALAGRARRFGLHTDASLRFERGVDPWLQQKAIHRATALLIDIAGGEPGPLSTECSSKHMPARDPIMLRAQRIDRLLGVEIAPDEVAAILSGLGMLLNDEDGGWIVTPPGHRFDIAIEEDLIEEVARIYGYDRIPEKPPRTVMHMPEVTESRVAESRIRSVMIERGYQEAMTYSFISTDLDRQFAGDGTQAELINPISEELAVMRRSLWPGLLEAAKNNLSRQQERVRLFEIGMRYYSQKVDFKEVNTLSGVVSGNRLPEQWASAAKSVDLFDIKGDLEAVLRPTGNISSLSYRAEENPVLRPGQSARALMDGEPIGWLGALHPQIVQQMDIDRDTWLFEVDIDAAFAAKIPEFQGISRYPSIRRDISILVAESVSVAEIQATVRQAAGELLSDLLIFDIYRGTGVDSGLKSVALGLILQDYSRTLTDTDGDAVVQAVVGQLHKSHQANLRER